MTGAIVRGHTWTEEWRHECEVRYVLAMTSRQQRSDYLDAITKKRGEQAGLRLRDDVATAWHARRAAAQSPAPTAEGQGGTCGPGVHLAVNATCTESVPGDGSFLAGGAGGNSDPDRCVESGVAA